MGYESTLAKLLNEYRVIPRTLLVVYYSFFMYAFTWLSAWFMAYDFNSISDPTVALAIAGYPTAILGVLTGVLSTLTKNYMSTGNSE